MAVRQSLFDAMFLALAGFVEGFAVSVSNRRPLLNGASIFWQMLSRILCRLLL